MSLRRISLALGLVLACLAAFALPVRANDLQDANQLLKEGRYAQALAKTSRYLASRPKNARGRFLKGLILTEMNRDKAAIEVFTKLTEDYPQLPEPYNNLAVIYAKHKHYNKARQELEMAIRTNPSYETARENLGDIYARLASQAYDKALQIDSHNASAKTKLALIRELVGENRKTTQIPAAPHGMSVAVATPARPPETAVAPKPAQVRPTPRPALAATPRPAVAPTPRPAAKPAPEPVVKTAPQGATNLAGVRAQVGAAVSAWAAAWSAKDVETYLSFYAGDFRTPGGESRAAWRAERTKHLTKPGPIQVSIEQLRVTTDGPFRATARFSQLYRSANYNSNGTKVLVLEKVGDKWLIRSEHIYNEHIVG